MRLAEDPFKKLADVLIQYFRPPKSSWNETGGEEAGEMSIQRQKRPKFTNLAQKVRAGK